MIIGTAGHIDHGKTTLVCALTGVDTDRLKEEKARGITIELGYAYLPVPSGNAAETNDPAEVLGFIDVPGHERFVHTMAAGAAGIDHLLLVVAADDGVMPQTREHLAIAELFGITEGAVALTKRDRADAPQIAAVRAEVAALLAGTPLAGAPVFETGLPPLPVGKQLSEETLPPLSPGARPGEAPSPLLPAGERLGEGPHDASTLHGLDALRDHLFATARRQQARRQDGLFRLAIDRVFTLAGHGTVVTGTVFGGRVRAGETVTHFGAGSGDGSAPARAVRVRSLHAQNRAADQGTAGQRVALNLAGVDKSDIARGDWIADARLLQATQRIDVRVRLLHDAPPISAWTPLHVHLGAAHRLAHAVPLEGDTVTAAGAAMDMAGQGGRPKSTASQSAEARHATAHPRAESASTPTPRGTRVQLVFDSPIFVVPGDRLILRNAQGTRTVGGGVVLDPQAPERRRRSAERMQWLDAMEALIGSGHAVGEGDARPLLAVAPAGLTRSTLMRLLGRVPAPDWAGPDAPAFALGHAGPPTGAAPGAAGASTGSAQSRSTGTGQARVGEGDMLWLSPAVWAQVQARILDALERHHARAPDEPGLNSARLQRMAFPSQQGATPGWPAWLDKLVADSAIARSGQWLHLPGHRITLSAAETALAEQLMPLLLAGGNDPPWVRDLARATGTREDAVRDLLRKQARLGALYQVVKDLFYPAERIAELANTFAALSANATAVAAAAVETSPAEALPSSDVSDLPPKPSPSKATQNTPRKTALPPGAVEARTFRDAVQLGRKRAIQILEFFDRIGYTRRISDAHLPRPNTKWTAEGPASGQSDAP